MLTCCALNTNPVYYTQKIKAQQYVYRTFHYETRQMTLQRHYYDANLTIPHGYSTAWRDDGKVWQEGNYKMGLKHGQWIEHVSAKNTSKGLYSKGNKHGAWETRDSTGALKIKEIYNNGAIVSVELMDTTGAIDSAEYLTRVYPMFPCNPALKVDTAKCSEASLNLFLAQNIKYPKFARQEAIIGKVYVSFVVDKTGEITNIHFINGICRAFEAEVVRVLQAMPKWSPGYSRGLPVKVSYILPIVFRLE